MSGLAAALKRALPLFLAFVMAAPSAAQVPPSTARDSAHEAAVMKMLEAMHVGDAIMEMLEAASRDSSAWGGLPEAYRTAIVAKARERLPDLVRIIAPGYAAQLTPNDVEQITAFYLSPPGMHLVAVKNANEVEMSEAAQRWGMKVVGEVMVEMGDQPPPVTEN
jgi:hypothetical protein